MDLHIQPVDDNGRNQCSNVSRPRNATECYCPAPSLWHNWLNIASRNPVLCLGKETGVCVLRFADLLTEIRIVRVFRIDSDRVGSVVKMPDHPTLIQRQIQFLTLLPTIALDRIETFRIELFSRLEKLRVITSC